MRSRRGRRVLFAVSALVTSMSGAAAANEKAVCVAAYDRAQQLRIQNKLLAAREELVSCTREVCPKLVRTDCARWMDEVTASIPTVVFGARDARGRDLANIVVSFDGKRVPEQLGQEVRVDPGVHTVRFQMEGAAPVEEHVVIRAGEKSRPIVGTLSPTAPVDVASAPKSSAAMDASSAHESSPAGRPFPILVPILGGAGVAALGVGAYLALSATSTLHTMRSTCAPHCDASDVDTVNLRYGAAAVTAGIGTVALGVAAWLFFRHASAPPSERPLANVDWTIAPSASGVAAGLRLRL